MFEYSKKVHPKETSCRFTDYSMDEFPKDWLFDLDHDDDWHDWQCARLDMYGDVLLKACKCGCVGIWNGKSRIHYYLHNSTRYDGLQLTCWDELGPVGHADVTTAEKLALEVSWTSFTVYDCAA